MSTVADDTKQTTVETVPPLSSSLLMDFVRRLIREKPLGAAGALVFLIFLF